LQPNPIDRMLGDHKLAWSPVFSIIGFVTRLLSPYGFDPADYNPLRDVVEQSIDFDVLRRPDCPVKLFLSATNVRTGKVKIFAGNEISASAVMAFACLPTMFHAVEIDGEAYWDGGYMGNPALFPLIYNCKSTDIVVVHINPLFPADDILDPHQRNQLQLDFDAGNARSQLRHEARHARPRHRRTAAACTDPQHRGRRFMGALS
jgi:NTE family protein